MDEIMCHEMFLEKDSTNNIKISRDLVLTMGAGVFFKNNIDVGIFVDSLMNKIHRKALFMKNSTAFADISDIKNVQNTAAIRRLYFLGSKGGAVKRKLMIDTSIYTENRQFMLVLSSKTKEVPDARFTRMPVFQSRRYARFHDGYVTGILPLISNNPNVIRPFFLNNPNGIP